MTEQVGRYEIIEEIGEGGFAVVYRARDIELDRPVALKELRPILLNDKEWVKRFRREAKTIARLDHAHIVTIHDVYHTDDRLFIVMRLVDGPSLDDLIATEGRLPWAEATGILTAVSDGLGHAHARDILHRDLKPANILMDPERGPMLTDFGLAKLASESSMSITGSGGIVGTPHYIAPEVWEGKGTTRQSDIYALGCILYEMLTGEKIFKGETPPAVMMAHFTPPTFPQTWPKGVPAGVTTVLKTALAGQPTARYRTVGEMVTALAKLSETDFRAAESPAPPLEIDSDLPDKSVRPEAASLLETSDGKPDAPPPAEQNIRSSAESDPKHTERQRSSVNSILQNLEATIADLPPKWHRYLRFFSVSVIIVVALAFINLLTSRYPWFAWVALVIGILLALHFVNLLFGDVKKPTASPAPDAQPGPSPAPPPAKVESGLSARLPDQPEPSPVSAPTATPVPTPPHLMGRRHRKKSACLWLSVIAVGLGLIGVIGVAGFCSFAGSFMSNAFHDVVVGETMTDDIQVAIPDSAQTSKLNIEFYGGQLTLAPGAAAPLLVDGTAIYNVDLLEPQIDINNNEVKLFTKDDIGFGSFGTAGLKNSWDLKLGPVPMELNIGTGGAQTELELGGLSLTDLTVSQGIADFKLAFSEPNRVAMGTMEFSGGASNAELRGLANTRTGNIKFGGGAGNYMLDFGGELQEDMDVTIEGGLGSIAVIIPQNVRATVSAGGPMSNVQMQGAWQESGEQYILPGEGPTINIKVDMGFGTLTLRNE